MLFTNIFVLLFLIKVVRYIYVYKLSFTKLLMYMDTCITITIMYYVCLCPIENVLLGLTMINTLKIQGLKLDFFGDLLVHAIF